jgi:hypothetical protein
LAACLALFPISEKVLVELIVLINLDIVLVCVHFGEILQTFLDDGVWIFQFSLFKLVFFEQQGLDHVGLIVDKSLTTLLTHLYDILFK